MHVAALIARRQAAADAHDKARARWPGQAQRSLEFATALRPLIRELAAIAEEMEQCAGAPPIEKARSWMWLGDAWFDYAQGRNTTLDDAVAAYERAEPWVVDSGDEAMRTKYLVNSANVLSRAKKDDIAGLREVIARYDEALPLVPRHIPSRLSQVMDERARALQMLRALEELEREMARQRASLFELAKRVRANANLPKSSREAMATMLERLAPRDLHGFQEMLPVFMRAREDFDALMVVSSQPTDPAHRSSAVSALALELWQRISADALRVEVSKDLRDALFPLSGAVTKLRAQLAAIGGDACTALERDLLRPRAREARVLLGRQGLTWVEPLRPVPQAHVDVNTVHATSRLPALERAAAARGLKIRVFAPGVELGAARFASIACAGVVVIVLSGDTAARAAACYEFGLALVLGRPLVIVTGKDAAPFDIDLLPVVLGETDEHGELGAAMDRALIVPLTQPGELDLPALVRAAERRFGADPAALSALDILQRAQGPVAAKAPLELLAKRAPNAMVVESTWPRRYPSETRRLFHVMPFGPEWSRGVRDEVEELCRDVGTTYRRHDDVADPRIVRSLWDEIGLATHILVDVTGMNLNVLVELGMAHALGTPVLMVGQPGAVKELPPALKGIRVDTYRLGTDELRVAVRDLLGR